PVQVCLGDLDRGRLPRRQRVGELGRRAPDEVAHDLWGTHCSSPRILGTLKRCPSCSGAPDSASSAVSPGTTTSARNTLVNGSAWEVGGVFSSATPLIEATDSRITDSWGARWSSSASVRSNRARFARRAIGCLVSEGPEELVSHMPTILGEATGRSRTACLG